MATLTEMNPLRVPEAVAEPDPLSTLPRWKAFLAITSRWSTAIVLVVLAGVAVWGHHTDWKLPKFSALMFGSKVGKEDWCDEHNVPRLEAGELEEKREDVRQLVALGD